MIARVARRDAGDARVVLRIVHWGDPNEGQIMADLVSAFEHDHPGIRVERIHVNQGDFDSKLKTMFASGGPPDLFYLKPESLPEMADMRLVRPLDADFGPAELDRFFPKLVEVFRYDGKQGGAGPLYGIPKDFSTSVMYVNLDLFDRAGVPVPYGGWTWDKYADAMRKITALTTPNQKVYGGVMPLWDATLLNVLWTYDGDFFGGSVSRRPAPRAGRAARDGDDPATATR